LKSSGGIIQERIKMNGCRGIINGLVISLAFWILLALVVVLVVHFFPTVARCRTGCRSLLTLYRGLTEPHNTTRCPVRDTRLKNP